MNSPKKLRIILHLGAEKTGSSALQFFLSSNRSKLLEKGICYLSEGLLTHGKKTLNHQKFFQFIQGNASKTEKLSTINELEKNWLAAQKKGIHTLIISWESAGLQNPLINYLGTTQIFEVVPILYLRRQDEWIASGWKQYGIKLGKCKSFADWVEIATTEKFWLQKINWKSRLALIANSLSNTNINVFLYDREKPSNAIFKDFCELLGIDISILNQSKIGHVKNESMHPDLLELSRMCYSLLKQPFDEEINKMLSFYLAEEYPKYNVRKLISLDMHSKIIAHFKESNSFINEKYFESQRIKLPTAIESEFKEHPNYNEISEGKIYELLLKIFIKQAEEIKNLSSAYDEYHDGSLI